MHRYYWTKCWVYLRFLLILNESNGLLYCFKSGFWGHRFPITVMSHVDELCSRRKQPQTGAHTAYLKILTEIQHLFCRIPFPEKRTNTQCLPLISRIISTLSSFGQCITVAEGRTETIRSDRGKRQLMGGNRARIIIKYAAEIHHRTRNHYGFLVVWKIH